MGPKYRIAILFHKNDRHYKLSTYMVDHFAACWRADGHEVTYLFGVKKFVPADILLVHVNLTIVPDEYLEFAERYPLVLNGRIKDIRKSTISKSIVARGDSWTGPVIVKSDLNYSGKPELMLRQTWLERHSWRVQRMRRWVGGILGDPFVFAGKVGYAIYDRLADVPARWLDNRHVVVEKFLPERDKGMYCARVYQCLGDRWSCIRTFSKEPIVKVSSSVRAETVEPHDEIVQLRNKLAMDFGKIDYVINEGEVVPLDVNKTVGASLDALEESVLSARRYQAEGLYSYLRDRVECCSK